MRPVQNQYRTVLFDVRERRGAGGSDFRGISLDIETFCLASQSVPTTKEEQHLLNVSLETQTDLEESDEYSMVNEIGHVVRVRAGRLCVDNENSGKDVIKLIATLVYLKLDGSDDVDVQDKWTPTDGCKACESAHGNKNVVR